MIKTVKITQIHPEDVFYGERESIIGKVFTLHFAEDPIFRGWQTTVMDIDLLAMDRSDLSGFPFIGIMYEDVP